MYVAPRLWIAPGVSYLQNLALRPCGGASSSSVGAWEQCLATSPPPNPEKVTNMRASPWGRRSGAQVKGCDAVGLEEIPDGDSEDDGAKGEDEVIPRIAAELLVFLDLVEHVDR